jgi:glucose-1-phosphate cytidylyltransferase
MKVLILAGGMGTRLGEETEMKPKPMIEIGGKPILWHIMKIYSHYGFNEFIILVGYKGYMIKEYFANYFLHSSNLSFDLKNNTVEFLDNYSEPWKVTVLDTGLETMTGGRIKQAEKYVGNNPFLLTYGDGVADIDIAKLIAFHHLHKGLVTLTSVQPEGRFGALEISEDRVRKFNEKPKGDGSWINGGFFVCSPDVFKYIHGNDSIFERAPLEKIASENMLFAYKHTGFWKPMDTLRDKMMLNELWNLNAPWKIWK